MSHLSNLKLQNFRCYEQAALSDLSAGMIVLAGPNGAGKTNLLEAVSLLSPGRGLRGAKVLEIQKGDRPKESDSWAVSARVENNVSSVQIGTGLDVETGKRVVRINGKDAKGQNALAEYFSCVWLTPQMDRLFLDSSRERRKFLDRLVFTFDPGHAGRVTRYEKAQAQRSRLLKEGNFDSSWLGGLEAQMAETGTAIAAARVDFIERLQRACLERSDSYFPQVRLFVSGVIEEFLADHTALEAEDMFRAALAEHRGRDAQSGRAAVGPHRSDLKVYYAAKNMNADQCSTGEQKAFLIGLILAHARLIAAERGRPPVLLLDEVAAHLDEARRNALYEILMDLKAQVFLTGTEENLFDSLRGKAQFFHVLGGKIL